MDSQLSVEEFWERDQTLRQEIYKWVAEHGVNPADCTNIQIINDTVHFTTYKMNDQGKRYVVDGVVAMQKVIKQMSSPPPWKVVRDAD